MAMSDGMAELYELADHVAFDTELKRILTGKRLHDLADQWKAEREQAAADRTALAQVRHANDTERGEWSRLYALLSGSDNGTWSAADMERAIEAALAALAKAHEALAEDREKWNFDTALYVGALLLAKAYPENVFTGASGDDGPTCVVALRDALRTYAQRDALAQARALLPEELTECVAGRGYERCGRANVDKDNHCMYCLYPPWVHDLAQALSGAR